MKTDPHAPLNQLVIAALTVFGVVIILLATLALRQLWLQQHITDLSGAVQFSLEDLGQITEDIQSELAELRTATGEAPSLDALEEIAEALDSVDEQLDSIQKGLAEVVFADEPQAETTVAWIGEEEEPAVPQDWADQTFTIFAVLVGIASIAIAALLGLAIRQV